MNKTKNTILFALLVVQAALIAFLYRPGQNAAPPAANLFKGLAPEHLTAMTITDEQGKSISLLKKEGWQLSQGEYPADQIKIEGLIKRLADLKSSRLVSQTTSSHGRLKVADSDFNRKVELGLGDAKTVFFLGTSPSAKSIHLRLADAKEVYQITDLAAWEVQTDKESWWQAKYLSQPSANLTGLTITNPQGTIELVPDGKKGWQLKADPTTALDAKRLETLVNAISDVTVVSYLAKDFAPKGQALATVAYQNKEGSTTLQVWAKDKKEDGDQVVKSSSSPFYAKVKDYVIKDALEIKQGDLIAKPTTEDTATGAADRMPQAPPSDLLPPQVTTPNEK